MLDFFGYPENRSNGNVLEFQNAEKSNERGSKMMRRLGIVFCALGLVLAVDFKANAQDPTGNGQRSQSAGSVSKSN